MSLARPRLLFDLSILDDELTAIHLEEASALTIARFSESDTIKV